MRPASAAPTVAAAPHPPCAAAASGHTDDAAAPPSTEERCRDLLAASAAGDRAAFRDLYDLTSRRIFGVVVRVLRNHAMAEEVCQEVYLEMWQTCGRYDPRRGTTLGWMNTMAHRRAVDRVRAAEASSRRDTRHHVQDYTPVLDDTADQACRNLDAERVRTAMSSLTWLQRSAVELAFQGGYTHREVALLLDVPIGTAKARIRDGLIRLRSELAAA